jgi:hypothetical protein
MVSHRSEEKKTKDVYKQLFIKYWKVFVFVELFTTYGYQVDQSIVESISLITFLVNYHNGSDKPFKWQGVGT